ncbi:MAG: hypothetical protein NC094_13745, partial [Bacteroidales bacterium]|nr:hypothetical protein [Lachnoclostridium sp.]MCM1466464.1 hypothetical protein [Bacteroidales bacterium]
MKKILCFTLLLLLSCYYGCGKREESETQGEAPRDDGYVYDRLFSLIEQSVSDSHHFTTAFWNDGGLLEEDPSGEAWTFTFDDELDAGISIRVEKLEDYWWCARYMVYEDGKEVDGFEASLGYDPPPLEAYYVDITGDGNGDLVINGNKLYRAMHATPWVYAYDLQNRERISVFDTGCIDNIDVRDGDGGLTEKQTEQMKALVEKDGRFQELFPDGELAYDGGFSICSEPIVDADGKVYFCAPIWGNDFTGDVDGSILLFLTYNADTKEFDVCDILYSGSQQETQQDKRHVYDRLYFLALESSIDDRTDCWAGNENGKMEEDPSGMAWTFEFDDELDVDIY